MRHPEWASFLGRMQTARLCNRQSWALWDLRRFSMWFVRESVWPCSRAEERFYKGWAIGIPQKSRNAEIHRNVQETRRRGRTEKIACDVETKYIKRNRFDIISFYLGQTLPFYRLLLCPFYLSLFAWLTWVFLCFLGVVWKESKFSGRSGFCVWLIWAVLVFVSWNKKEEVEEEEVEVVHCFCDSLKCSVSWKCVLKCFYILGATLPYWGDERWFSLSFVKWGKSLQRRVLLKPQR